VALSGCYTFAGLTLSRTKLVEGESSTVTVRSSPSHEDKYPHGTVYFLVVGLVDDGVNGNNDDNSLGVQGKGHFDVTHQVYNRAKPLVRNHDILTALEADGQCGPYDLTSQPYGGMTLEVLATKTPVKDTESKATQVVSRFDIHQFNPAAVSEPADSNPVYAAVLQGTWGDDGDGVVETGDDELTCNGGADILVNRQLAH
jgi:hypothetical protein